MPSPPLPGAGTPQCPLQHCLPCCHKKDACAHCSLQAENTGMQNSNVTLALAVWTWSGMAEGITSLPCQPPAYPLAATEGLHAVGESRQECRQQGGSNQPLPSAAMPGHKPAAWCREAGRALGVLGSPGRRKRLSSPHAVPNTGAIFTQLQAWVSASCL